MLLHCLVTALVVANHTNANCGNDASRIGGTTHFLSTPVVCVAATDHGARRFDEPHLHRFWRCIGNTLPHVAAGGSACMHRQFAVHGRSAHDDDEHEQEHSHYELRCCVGTVGRDRHDNTVDLCSTTNVSMRGVSIDGARV